MEENQKEKDEQKKKKERKSYQLIGGLCVLSLVFRKLTGKEIFESDELLMTIIALFGCAVSYIKLNFFLKD